MHELKKNKTKHGGQFIDLPLLLKSAPELVRFEWRIILHQTFLLSQAKTQILSLVNWKEDISMIYNSRIMVEQRTLKTQEMFKYSCGIRASTMRSCNYFKHREGFHLSGVYHPKISRGEMHNKLWLLYTNHSPVYTIKPFTGNNLCRPSF